ncbi:MAG: 50S ribosomal protein L10 [Bacteroidetes bacterium]|nr:50S ribosomal protein L10 [Bacteroidota bacterium]
MTREEKNQAIETLTEKLRGSNNVYFTDISNLNSERTSNLRRLCFRRDVKLVVVKNNLLKKAMHKSGRNYESLYNILKGSTSLMISASGNAPAMLIKEFRKDSDRPVLKGAYVEETVYVGDEQLEALIHIKSKNELIADIIFLLQSPARNVISALQSGGHTLSGIVKTLSDRLE